MPLCVLHRAFQESDSLTPCPATPSGPEKWVALPGETSRFEISLTRAFTELLRYIKGKLPSWSALQPHMLCARLSGLGAWPSLSLSAVVQATTRRVSAWT